MTRFPPATESAPLPSPAFRIALLFASGITLGSALHPAAPLCLYISLALWTATLCSLHRHLAGFLPLFAGLLCVAAGAMRCAFDAPAFPPLPEPADAARVLVTGVVESPPREKGGRVAFTFQADSCYASGSGNPFSARLAVTLRRTKGDRGRACPSCGTRAALRGSISAPPGERNPGGFNLRIYDESRGIAGLLFVNGFDDIVIRDSCAGPWFFTRCVYPAREAIIRAAGEMVRGSEGEFLKDLLLGERSGITAETREAFIDAGVAHVLAVSGYRVVLLSGLILGALNLVRIPRRLQPLVAAPALLFYMCLSLCHPPVVRGTVMALVFMMGRVFQRRTNSLNSLGVAALVLLVVDSRTLFDTGFQLSFGAVLAILFFLPPQREPAGLRRAGGIARWITGAAAVSVIVSLGTLPLSAAAFGRVSLVGIIANIVVVPATGAGMLLGVISLCAGALSPPLGAAYAALEGILLRLTIRFSLYAASVPYAAIDTGPFGAWGTLSWYAFMALAAGWRDRRRAARCAAVMLGALCCAVFQGPDPAGAACAGLLRVTMIDVGQGDAILVEFPSGETLLVDAGPVTPAGNAGKNIILPFLKRKGIRSLDMLLLTHPDADHCGGAASIIRGMPVARVIEGSAQGTSSAAIAYRSAASLRGTPLVRTKRGETLAAPACARIYVLWPGGGADSAGFAVGADVG